jgi:hypothetical protein
MWGLRKMNQGDLAALTQEIERYKDAQQYTECILRMDHYERETTDPVVKAVLLTAKATCALEIEDIEGAKRAVSRIDTVSLTIPMQNYVNLTKATVAHEMDQVSSMRTSITGWGRFTYSKGTSYRQSRILRMHSRIDRADGFAGRTFWLR